MKKTSKTIKAINIDGLSQCCGSPSILNSSIINSPHRKEAQIFQEFSLFTDMAVNQMEYEANLFAAEISLPNTEILEYFYQGYDAKFIAAAMDSNINLVALKVAALNRRGHLLQF